MVPPAPGGKPEGPGLIRKRNQSDLRRSGRAEREEQGHRGARRLPRSRAAPPRPLCGIGAPLRYASLRGGWLPGGGEEPAGRPGLEECVNDPRDTPPEPLTGIALPLRKRVPA